MVRKQSHVAAPQRARPERSARLEARITDAQKALIERAAAYEGRSVTDFVVGALAAAAETVVREHEVIWLNAAQSQSFVAALQKQVRPTAALRKAAARHRRLVEPV